MSQPRPPALSVFHSQGSFCLQEELVHMYLPDKNMKNMHITRNLSILSLQMNATRTLK